MASTKESLIRYFSSLDVATLEKLQKYSQLLIIPDEDLLTNATMTQMVSKAHALADSLFPEWTDRSKSDFGEFLVELFALFSEKDFWYINAFANEGIFRKMRSYSNAFSKASSLGYQPTTCKGSSANFSVTFAKGERIVYGRGELIITANGMDFSNDKAITLETSAGEVTKTLTLSEGKQVAEDVTYNGYSIFLSKDNIDIDSIAITIDNIAYIRVKNFGDSGKDSHHFMVLPEENGACSIYFGKDDFGVQPSLGKIITVEYRTCHGSDGNVGIDVSTITESNDDRKATLATMLTNATNGCFAESLTSIKEQAPATFAYKRAAINSTTAQTILNSYPFVHQSRVWSLGEDVYYSVIPESGRLEPTTAEKQYMKENFEPCLMLGFTGNQHNNIYVDIYNHLAIDKIVLDVVISAGYDQTTIEEGVRQVMEDITNPLIGATYGQTFSKSDIDIQIRSEVVGVQSVSFKKLVGSTESVIEDFTIGENEIFSKIDQSKLTIRINAI